MKKKLWWCLLILCCFPPAAHAQFSYGTTGLLFAPTADMQRDKTFLFGGGMIDQYSTVPYFRSSEISHTWNYYVNITIFPWLEVSYLLTLKWAETGSTYFPKSSWGKYANQDRAFSARLRLWKEGWWKPWTPQIVLGLDDPTTHSESGGGSITTGSDEGGYNNNLSRYYIAVSKHFHFEGVGDLGAHASFLIGNATRTLHYKRPAAGVNFQFDLPQDKFWAKALSGLNLMAEYYPIRYVGKDGNTTCGLNLGLNYRIWKDHINLWCVDYDMYSFSWGVALKIHLK